MQLYEQGYSDVEVCADLKMPFREFEKRLNNDDIFAKLVEYGRLASKAWWHSRARVNLNDKTFQHSTWYAVMKNRFGWAEKTENTDNAKPMEQMSNEEVETELLKAMRKGKKKIADLLAVKNVEVEEDSDGSSKVH